MPKGTANTAEGKARKLAAAISNIRGVRKPKHYASSWDRHLRLTYGITADQYDKMLEKQGGVCKICGNGRKNNKLSVDHNHGTNKVRGLLCVPCNLAVGRIETYAILDYINQARADDA